MDYPNLLIFYVENPLRSAEFYERLFKIPAKVTFPTWAVFAFPGGLELGLWSVKAKNFLSGGVGHRAELALVVPHEAEVRQLHDRWKTEGVHVEQQLHEAVFGLTFVALDPDSHRIRVCTPDK